MTSHSCDEVGLDFFDSAPTLHRVQRELAATPAQVFAAFRDADAWVSWAAPITRVEWTSGFPLEVGSTRTVHMWGGVVAHEEFIAYDEGTRMAFRFDEVSRKAVRAFAEDYQVTDLGAGRCRVQWSMAMDTGRRAGVAARLVDPAMRIGLAHMLGRFARLVESRSASAGVVR